MAKWMPSLADRKGPKYLRIVNALAEDIYAGRLPVGARLPTHRDLAWELGVTVGTVSRAYAEAERRGLVVGEVGRGSFVRGARSMATLAMPDLVRPDDVDLGINRPPKGPGLELFAEALNRVSTRDNLVDLMNYSPHTGLWEHREAGTRLMAGRGFETKTDRVLLISGVEHGIAAAFMALTDPGDTVLVEDLTWSGVRALASLLRLRLHPVRMDKDGLDPDALAAACEATGARLLCTIPTIHNPTSVIMPAGRRQAVAEIAGRYGLTIIEDDIYGLLPESSPPPIAHYAPERTVYLTGASKALLPCLRVGFAAMPEDRIGRFSAAARAANWMTSPIMAQIVADWINDGTAAVLTAQIRAVVAARQTVARRVFAGLSVNMAPASFHAWLQLPDPWRAQDFVAAAAKKRLSVPSTDLFVPGRSVTPHAVRITLTATAGELELEAALTELREIIASQPEPFLAVA
ncbi:MAG: PLP-dependent aminotransferase family protein [Azospirillaceae bacterium]